MGYCKPALRFAAAFCVACGVASAALGETGEAPPITPSANAAEAPARSFAERAEGLADEIWGRPALLGSTDIRDRLAGDGILLAADSIDEILGNAAGGVRRGAYYEGRFEVLATIDLEKLIGWQGATFHTNAYWVHGQGTSGHALGGNILTVSNIEATHSVRLFTLWVEQLFDGGKISVRAGQIAADDEFLVSDTASNLDNASFGWPAVMSNSLPDSGPVYDLATPGVRLKYAATDDLSLSAALTNGDPAPPGSGDPQRRNADGLSFRTDGGAFFIAEADYKSTLDIGDAAMPSSYKLGGWTHSARFADKHWDNLGRSLASPFSSGVAAMHDGDYGAYFVIDQVLYHVPETQDAGVSAFWRGGVSPQDRNFVSGYTDFGVAAKGMIPGRPNDLIAAGFALAKVSAAVSALDKDRVNLSHSTAPVHNFEAALEISYHLQPNQWWSLQPDVQYVVHPGGNTALAGSAKPVPDALVIGLRSAIVF